MQWDQHDSIRYNHHKPGCIANSSNLFDNSEETKSV